MADIRNAAPVQGEIHYAVPVVAVLVFGLFGLFTLWFAFSCPCFMRPFVLVASSVLILAQYGAVIIDFQQYPDAFVWYDGLLLPWYVLILPEAYGDPGHVIGLVLPCLFIAVSTIAIPVAWFYHMRLAMEEGVAREQREFAESQDA